VTPIFARVIIATQHRRVIEAYTVQVSGLLAEYWLRYLESKWEASNRSLQLVSDDDDVRPTSYLWRS